jgi:hypothetical protein
LHSLSSESDANVRLRIVKWGDGPKEKFEHRTPKQEKETPGDF